MHDAPVVFALEGSGYAVGVLTALILVLVTAKIVWSAITAQPKPVSTSPMRALIGR